MNDLAKQAAPTNVLIVGVGGQGVILISKMLAKMCQTQGLQVKQSEVHGMAKRGGIVFSHVRFGGEIWSPTIPMGEVDILVAMEWAEGLRWLPYMRPDSGTFITDTQKIIPPFAFRDRRRGGQPAYIKETVSDISRMVPNSYAVDATSMAHSIGNFRVANTVLLGILSTALPFSVEDWLDVVGDFAPPKTEELNHRAFQEGRNWVEESNGASRHPSTEPATTRPATTGPETAYAGAEPAEEFGHVTLEIEEVWCKACDICVKMCPERCLVLNGKGVVETTDISHCTGCRICEMLCPDFAITVRL